MSPRKSAAEARRTRERIVDRSVAMASVEGLEGLTLGRLAADLGMSKSGLLGHFGTKEELHRPRSAGPRRCSPGPCGSPSSADAAPGLARLRAACEAWTTYLDRERDTFPAAASSRPRRWSSAGRSGPVRDTVAGMGALWRRDLRIHARRAVNAGTSPRPPHQLVYELVGVMLALNDFLQLQQDPAAPARARRALDRLLCG